MNVNIFLGLMIPFAGTALGSMMVIFMKNEINRSLQKLLTGFALVCYSYYSLIA